LPTRGAEIRLQNCTIAVWVSWFKLHLHDGSYEWRYVVSTKKAHGLTIIKSGRVRWGIEAFFQCMKSRFGLDQFGRRTLLGVTRFILMCFLAYCSVACSRNELAKLPDWQELAIQTRRELMPMLNWLEVQLELALLVPILARDVQDYASTA
jgi:Transposase DDE domain